MTAAASRTDRQTQKLECLMPRPQRLDALAGAPMPLPRDLSAQGLTEEQQRFLPGLWHELPRGEEGSIRLRIDRDLQLPVKSDEAYRLVLDGDRAELAARGYPGLVRGLATVRQLAELYDGGPVPRVSVADWPAATWRAYQVDLARGMSYRPEFFSRLCRELADWKFNCLQLYLEHNFVWPTMPELAEVDAMTPAHARALEREAARWGITVVPAVNLSRHMEGFLNHPRFRHLKEMPRATPGVGVADSQICHAHAETWPLLRTVMDELMAAFSGPFIHLGFDEAHFVGRHPACAGKPPAAWFGEALAQACGYVLEHGRTPVIWGDKFIRRQDFPGRDVANCNGGHPAGIHQALKRVPRETVINDWHYDSDRADSVEFFRQRDFRVWAAGALLQAHFIAPRTLETLPAFCANSLAAGAEGVMITTWGTYAGHRHDDYRFPVAAVGELGWSGGPADMAAAAERWTTLRYGRKLPYLRLLRRLNEDCIAAFNRLSPAGTLGTRTKHKLWEGRGPFALSFEHGAPSPAAASRAQAAIDRGRAELARAAARALRRDDELLRLNFYLDLYQHTLDRLAVLPQAIQRYRALNAKSIEHLPSPSRRLRELRAIRALLQNLYDQSLAFVHELRTLVQQDGMPVRDLQQALAYVAALGESIQQARAAEETGLMPSTDVIFGDCAHRTF